MEDGKTTAGRIRRMSPTAADVYYLPSVTSTNSALKSMRKMRQLRRPTLLFTDDQTGGRGTRDREWLQMPKRDVAFSLALPEVTAGVVDPRLSLAVGALIARGVETEAQNQLQSAVSTAGNAGGGLALGLKWPNDLVVSHDDGLRKLGGVLIETSGGWVYIGVGLNVNSSAGDFPAELAPSLTTLRDELGSELDRGELVAALGLGLLAALHSEVDYAALLAEWLTRDRSSGARYQLSRNGENSTVSAVRVDPASGALICADAAGKELVVTSFTELSEADAGAASG